MWTLLNVVFVDEYMLRSWYGNVAVVQYLLPSANICRIIAFLSVILLQGTAVYMQTKPNVALTCCSGWISQSSTAAIYSQFTEWYTRHHWPTKLWPVIGGSLVSDITLSFPGVMVWLADKSEWLVTISVFQLISICWTIHCRCSGNDWKCSCSRITVNVIVQRLTCRICIGEVCAL